MFDPALAFDTYLNLDPQLSEAEFQAECDRLVQRQNAIAGLLKGETPVEQVEEMLFQHGIDPFEWAETAEDNLLWLLTHPYG